MCDRVFRDQRVITFFLQKSNVGMQNVYSAKPDFVTSLLKKGQRYQSIDSAPEKQRELKAGLKIALGTLLKQCSSIMIYNFATSGQKAVADEIGEFSEVFAAPIHYAKIMAAE